ncbi:MAG: XRE family transcriptional regulator [Steroidobacteraceae bacterium]|nr:XRE family transcriptional regulator [Steroidobacteraceae bacterium]
MFNPKRLTLARQRRKLTKKGLAEACGCDQKTIIRYEDGEIEPPPDSLATLVRVLDFPEGFFFGPDPDEVPVEAVSFRSLKAMLARDRDAALSAASFAFMLNDWVAERFTLPEPDLLAFKEDTDPEMAAQMLRQKWGLGERRVSNMVHLLESKGVRVFSLVEDTRSLDAFSMWRKNTPFVFLNTNTTAERSRFDAAHELGHLVLHHHGGPNGRVAEDQANQFASAFLMPKADVRARLARVRFLDEIIRAKRHWGVSVAALNHRLHRLGITTDWQYRTFCIQISEQFGRTEPLGMDRERSMLWQKVFTALRAERITKTKIANALNLPPAELENLVFQLTTMLPIDGHGSGSGKSRANLRLVR